MTGAASPAALAVRVLGMLRTYAVLDPDLVVEVLGVPRPAARRALRALAEDGMLTAGADGGEHRAGPVLRELSAALHDRFRVEHLARPLLVELAAASGETAQLGVLEGSLVRIADAVESSRRLRVGGAHGELVPPADGSLGPAILAALPDGRGGRRLDTDAGAAVEQARRLGYASTFDTHRVEGISTVAVAVPGCAAALAVCAPVVRMTAERHERQITLLRAACAELAARHRSQQEQEQEQT